MFSNKTITAFVIVWGGYLVWEPCGAGADLEYGWLMSTGKPADAQMEQKKGGDQVTFRAHSIETITAFVASGYPARVYERALNNREPVSVKYSPGNPLWCAVINKDHSAGRSLLVGGLKLLFGLGVVAWIVGLVRRNKACL